MYIIQRSFKNGLSLTGAKFRFIQIWKILTPQLVLNSVDE